MPDLLIGLFAVGQPLIGCEQINSFLKSLGENKLLFNGPSAVAEEQLRSVTRGNGIFVILNSHWDCFYIVLSFIMIVALCKMNKMFGDYV